MHRLVSAFGILVFLGVAWGMSSHRTRISPRVIVGGLLFQFGLGVFILRTGVGSRLFDAADAAFVAVLGCVSVGSTFVFGDVYAEHFFAFKVLPTIIFFSAFMSIFYYYGLMQWVVGLFARLMQITLGTSGAETLSAAANVFVGQTEAPLVIRPYVSSMTISELNAVMIGGLATMAGGVLAAYVEMGISAKDLLSASVMAAPAGLMIAKILQPEVDTPLTLGEVKVEVVDTSANVLEAIANGTSGGLQLALNVGAMLLVFLALIALLNAVFGWVGAQFGFVAVDGDQVRYLWSLEAMLGWLFQPVAWLLGIEWKDCHHAGQLLGLKMGATEFVAYSRLAEWTRTTDVVELSERSRRVMTFALCGFANFSSIGIQLGGIGGIAPDRRGDIARLALRAMFGGTLVALISGCIANILI